MTTFSVIPTNQRVADIASRIYATVRPISDAKAMQDEAQEAFQGAVTGRLNVREGIFLDLAALASTGNWTEREIDGAAKAAASMHNNKTDKSVGTMIAEGKNAMHPNVREKVGHFQRLRDEMWAAEVAVKDGPKPLKETFARAQHMLVRMMIAAKGGAALMTYEQVDTWVASMDPKLDPRKMYAKIEAALALLNEANAAFFTAVVEDAITALNSTTVDQYINISKGRIDADARLGETFPELTQDKPNDPAHVADVVDGAVDVFSLLYDVAA